MDLIPEKAFSNITFGHRRDGTPVVSNYGNHHGSVLALEHSRRVFGITKYQFGKLLGLDTRASIVMLHWYSGRSRPSQLYMMRVCWLHILYWDQKIDLVRIKTIDWNTGDITLRGEKEPVKDYKLELLGATA
jgi:hypothetical protein